MKAINYLILGCVLGVIGLLVTNGLRDLRYILISVVGIVFCIIAIIKND